MKRISFPQAAPAGLLALLLAAGCGADQEGGGGFSMPPTPVETAEVLRQPVADRFSAVGTLEAGEAITVVAEISAAVVSLPFEEGGEIARGGLIARLDDAQLQAEVDRARALRDQGRTSFERVRAVVDAGAGAPQDLDDAAAALKVAESNLALAEARLAKTRIEAPFGGILGARRVSPGAFLRAGDPITDLANVEEMRVLFSAPERHLAKLRKGSEVVVTAAAYPDLEVRGRIDVVEPVLDPATRAARIVARIENPGRLLRPGMSADVSAILSLRPDALTIPSEAVFVEGDQFFAYTIGPDSTVARATLVLGARTADRVEVLSGLREGDRVVRAGHQKLFAGARAAPVESRASPAGGVPPAAAGSEESDEDQ